jgi:methylenetetrahydrofolate dehydrogenase (NADP+) / methenyltetrahydrofolate cyclohydrolase
MLQLKGKPVADQIYSQIKTRLQDGLKAPHLAVILVGDDGASQVYVSHKQKACADLGFKSTLIRLPATTTAEQLKKQITDLNEDSEVNGILLQLPLPAHLEPKSMTDLISPEKDADGLTTTSLGLLASHRQKAASCTPSGIIEILKHYNIDVSGQNVLVIGRSLIVGLPLFHLLNQKNATVTLAHSKTPDLLQQVKNFDFVFVAVGKPHFLKASDFKKNAIVIDIGIHRTDAGLVGDVDPVGAEDHLDAMSPVPGGVGPMTIAMLMQNTFHLTYPKVSL